MEGPVSFNERDSAVSSRAAFLGDRGAFVLDLIPELGEVRSGVAVRGGRHWVVWFGDMYKTAVPDQLSQDTHLKYGTFCTVTHGEP